MCRHYCTKVYRRAQMHVYVRYQSLYACSKARRCDIKMCVYMQNVCLYTCKNWMFVYVRKCMSFPFFDVSTIVSLRVLTHVYKLIHVCIRTCGKFVYISRGWVYTHTMNVRIHAKKVSLYVKIRVCLQTWIRLYTKMNST